MSLIMETKLFSDWLQDEMNKRGWSQSDLSRNSGVNRQVISTYINQQRKKPDENILIDIARALNLPLRRPSSGPPACCRQSPTADSQI
jgi:transcriptional regulator with XRE-family HTH domain